MLSFGRMAPTGDENQSARSLSDALRAAETAYNGGDWTTAVRLCSQILALHANHLEALHLSGIIKARTGQLPEAAELLRRAAAAGLHSAIVHNSYGNVLRDLARYQDAVDSYGRALQIQPDYPEACCNRGGALLALGRIDEALQSYERALQFRPDYAEAHYNRGVVLQDLGRLEEALGSYAQALRIQPMLAHAHYNSGNILNSLNRFEEALRSYDQALRIRGDFAAAYNNRGNALANLGRPEEALRSYERALQIAADLADAHDNLGNVLSLLNRPQEALASYERALHFNPTLRWTRGSWLHAKLLLCDWNGVNSAVEDLTRRVLERQRATHPFIMLAVSDDPALLRCAAEISGDAAELASRPLPPLSRRPRPARIRVGYYSADYHNHATAQLAAELFELHDRKQFEIVAFSFGPHAIDPMRQRLLEAFDRFVDVREKSDREIAQLSRQLEVDIAVDLKGFTQGSRPGIFAHRAAPIQINYLGYPGTMGSGYMDYIVADSTLIPAQSRRHYGESMLYLPHSYQVNDRRRAIAERRFSRAELGLPQTGCIFCCFNSSYKITTEVFESWMRILHRVEHSVLWLLGGESATGRNLRAEAERRGVSGARLVLAERLPPALHLARYRAADLFLDSFPCGAHTTASDALWAGLPVVTRTGESFASRVAASLLNAIGMPELVTSAAADYESLAIELATDRDRLAATTLKLHENRMTQPLFDTPLFTRNLEQAYLAVHDRYHADLPPCDLMPVTGGC